MPTTTTKLHLNHDTTLTRDARRRTMVFEKGGASMFLRSAVAAVFALLAAPTVTKAQQTEAYFYDVHGRVQAVTRAPANGGSRTRYSLDSADNRDNKIIGNTAVRAANDRLAGGENLLPSQELTSADARFTFLLQHTDGNAVIYGPSGALWGSNTGYGQSTALVMQPDGNVVIRSPNNDVLWSTGTGGNPGAVLIMQNDGNLVLYVGFTPIWATGTGGH